MLTVKDRAPYGGGKFLAAGPVVGLSRTFRSQSSEATPGAGVRSGHRAVRRPQGRSEVGSQDSEETPGEGLNQVTEQ